MRRAFLLLLAGLALLAGCGGGDDDEATIQELRIAYTAGSRELTADTWTLRGGDDAAVRSRLRDGRGVVSDVALSEGFFTYYTPGSGLVQDPAGSALSPDPFALADDLVEQGGLTAAGTVRRDGTEIQSYTGPAEPILLGGRPGTIDPADATMRYLRDEAAGRPVELRIAAARVHPEDGPPSRLPAQRYLVTDVREYAATEEAMAVFDLEAAYDEAGTATTTAP
jgi:hypothetical protein